MREGRRRKESKSREEVAVEETYNVPNKSGPVEERGTECEGGKNTAQKQ